MTPEQVSTMGRHASEVLENPAYTRAFNLLRQEIVQAWANANVRDTAGQQLILQQMKVLDRLAVTMESLMKAGQDVDAILRKARRESDDEINESAGRRGLRAVSRMAKRTA